MKTIELPKEAVTTVSRDIAEGKKIQAIKTIRSYMYLGLKEAKDLVEDIMAGTTEMVAITVDPEVFLLRAENERLKQENLDKEARIQESYNENTKLRDQIRDLQNKIWCATREVQDAVHLSVDKIEGYYAGERYSIELPGCRELSEVIKVITGE